MADTDELFKRKLLDLAHRASNHGFYTFSSFLSLQEQDIMTRMDRDLDFVDHTLYGGNEAAERRIAVFGSEAEFGYPPVYPISVIAVEPASEKFAEELSHRDYLGAILNLGIERSVIGDIIIRSKRAWFYCLDSAAELIVSELTKVRHTNVSCRIETEDVPELRPVLEEVSYNVASERIDCVVSAFTGLSRNHCTDLFTMSRVNLNGRIITATDKALKEGDVLSVRGFGKCIYDGISGQSKKGRLYVTLRKYV